MASVVCTLFEGHYYEGVAGLVNSLYNNGYAGEVFVGYRGNLTSWTAFAVNNYDLNWPGARTLDVAEELKVHFLPIDTHFHFTTYKPYFMLNLIEGLAKNADGIHYFDPDIVIKCNWSFYEEWITFGVGLVHEVVSRDMPPNHPVRFKWKKLIEQSGRANNNMLYSGFNAGYCGVSKLYTEFIKTWIDIIDTAIKFHNFNPGVFMLNDKTSIFCGDQDGLNIAAMCCNSPLSEMGPEAMGFLPGGFTMFHATSSPKPWKKNFILYALKGVNPSISEKEFWLNVSGPIFSYTQAKIGIKKVSILFASLIGRFYQRS